MNYESFWKEMDEWTQRIAEQVRFPLSHPNLIENDNGTISFNRPTTFPQDKPND